MCHAPGRYISQSMQAERLTRLLHKAYIVPHARRFGRPRYGWIQQGDDESPSEGPNMTSTSITHFGHLRAEGSVEAVDLGMRARCGAHAGAVTCSIPHPGARRRGPAGVLQSGVSRSREIAHDSNLYATCLPGSRHVGTKEKRDDLAPTVQLG
jgi:hypothetical protein